MMVLGLTGNLGSGKSTILKMFEECGAEVIDTDIIAHTLMQSGGACAAAVCKTFPDAFCDGKIQRDVLADIVFESPRKLKVLENIVHPAVRKEVVKRIKIFLKKRNLRMIVVDVPLLFEAGFEDLFDVVVVARSNQKLQLERLKKSRNISRREISRRMSRQIPQVEKIKRADFVIDNRHTKVKTRAQVRRIWGSLVYESR